MTPPHLLCDFCKLERWVGRRLFPQADTGSTLILFGCAKCLESWDARGLTLERVNALTDEALDEFIGSVLYWVGIWPSVTAEGFTETRAPYPVPEHERRGGVRMALRRLMSESHDLSHDSNVATLAKLSRDGGI